MCVNVRERKPACCTHAIMQACQGASRVKNGTCQDRRRQERSDNKELGEREEEGRNDKKIRDT